MFSIFITIWMPVNTEVLKIQHLLKQDEQGGKWEYSLISFNDRRYGLPCRLRTYKRFFPTVPFYSFH